MVLHLHPVAEEEAVPSKSKERKRERTNATPIVSFCLRIMLSLLFHD